MHTAVNAIRVFVGNLDAELLFVAVNINNNNAANRQSRTSSIAMTTSTVSRLSRPRSFEKCAVVDS